MQNIETKNYTPAYLVFASDLGYLLRTTKNYKRDALIIKNDEHGSCSPTFHLLTSLAFELFPKVLIGYQVCLKYQNDRTMTDEKIREEISNEIKKYNHKIDKVYLASHDLIKELDIKNITSFNNGFVWEYRIELNTGNDHIAIKDIEAIRYGSFASNRDVATFCVNDHILVDLINKIEKYVETIEVETNEQLKKFLYDNKS